MLYWPYNRALRDDHRGSSTFRHEVIIVLPDLTSRNDGLEWLVFTVKSGVKRVSVPSGRKSAVKKITVTRSAYFLPSNGGGLVIIRFPHLCHISEDSIPWTPYHISELCGMILKIV